MITTILGCLIANILFFGIISLVSYLFYKKNKEKIDNVINDVTEKVGEVQSLIDAIKNLKEDFESLKSKLDKLPF